MNVPIILLEGKYTIEMLHDLKQASDILCIKDVYTLQLRELFLTKHPNLEKAPDLESLFETYVSEIISRCGEHDICGDWIYFPWSKLLVHSLPEKDYYFLRTNRNKQLITKDEQHILRSATIAVAGLSIGSNMMHSLVYNGIAQYWHVAEFDVLDVTNLNRLRGRIDQVGEKKMNIVCAPAYEVDPYLHIKQFEQGLDETNLDQFIEGETQASIIIDAVDDFKMKIRMRVEARKKGIPVLMATNIHDRMMFDVERYDLDNTLELFNGKVPEDMIDEILNASTEDANRYAIGIVGKENVSEKTLQSLSEIGTTLAGRPQLMSTVTATSGVITYLIRDILLGKPVPSARTSIWIPDLFLN